MKKTIMVFLLLTLLNNKVFSYYENSTKYETPIIGKVSSNNFNLIHNEEYKKLTLKEKIINKYVSLNYNLHKLKETGYDLSWISGDFILIENNYFLSEGGEIKGKIKKDIIKKLNNFKNSYKKGDIIVYERSILNEDDTIKKVLGENIIVSYFYGKTSKLNDNFYKIECNNNKFEIIKINNGLYDIDLNTDNFKKYLNKEIKTCYNFYSFFNEEKNFSYRDRNDYYSKLDKYKKLLKNKYSSVFLKSSLNQKNKTLLKIKDIRKKINNNISLTKNELYKKNILIDAFKYILETQIWIQKSNK